MAHSGTAHAHIQDALRNYGPYERLRAEGVYLDWALTVLFYTALHLVVAHAAEQRAPLDNDHASLRR